MINYQKVALDDTGERMIPPREGEISVVFSRHKFVYQYVKQYVVGKDVLDIGCGTGYGCKILAEDANYVLGIDYSEKAIEYCKTHFDAPNIDFQRNDATELALEKKFDIAVSFQVIEHMRDVEDFIDRMKQSVKVNGLIFITTPNAKKEDFDNHKAENPFHFNEMNYGQFERLLSSKFQTYRILGIGNSSKNRLRSLIQKIPFYQKIGLLLKRGSKIKKVANKAMDLTHFRVVEERVGEESADLFAICTKE